MSARTFWAYMHSSGLSEPPSAIQQAAAAGATLVEMFLVFVLARAFDGATR
jgi:hypothetical protein